MQVPQPEKHIPQLLLSLAIRNRSPFCVPQPENILLMDKAAPDGGMAVKVIDFGLSNTFVQGSTLTTACGSPAYASPEMILRVAGGYNPRKSDREC